MSFNVFEGDYKQKRNISLGGAAKTADKRDLLQKTQNERRAREQEKLRQKSATRIQAFYRGRKSAAETRRSVRIDFLNRLASFEILLTSQDANAPEAIPVLFELISSFLFFYRPGYIDDEETTVKLCRVLLKKSDKKKGSMILTLPFEEARNYNDWKGWTGQLQRFAQILVAFVGRCFGAASSPRVIDPLTVISYLTDSQTYASIITRDFPVQQTYQQIFLHLLHNAKLYSNICTYLLTLHPIEDKALPIVARCISIVVSPFKSSISISTDILDVFISEFLSIPLLPNRISIESIKMLSKRMPFEEVVIRLAKIADTIPVRGASPPEAVLSLLANILAFGNQRIPKMTTSCWAGYLDTLIGLLARIPAGILADDQPSDFGRLEEAEEDDEGNDGDGDVRMIGFKADKKITISLRKKIDSRQQKWLNILHDRDHIVGLLNFYNTKLAATGESQYILHLANYFASLLLKSALNKTAILNQLIIFQTASSYTSKISEHTFIQSLWASFKYSKLYPQLTGEGTANRGPAWAAAVMDERLSYDWSVLWLLGELISRVLLVMGDDEFFDDSNGRGGGGLGFKETVVLIEILRNVTFTLYWHESLISSDTPLPRTSLTPSHLRATLTKATQQLHTRHSRRPFTSADHWLVEGLDMDSFMRSIMEDDEAEHDVAMTDGSEEEQGRVHKVISGLGGSVSVRLGVLQHVPFVIPFEERVRIFSQFINADRMRNHVDEFRRTHSPARGTIRRSHVFEDGFDYLNILGPRLKNRVSISFIDDFGLPEAGIDGGGVFKEFLTALARQAFNTNYGLFLSTQDQLLYPNPHIYATESSQLNYFEFLGRIIGKALYEGILVDVGFAGFFLCKWLGRISYLDDLPSLDPELYQGLIFLKNYQGDVEDLALNFTITDNDFDKPRTIELIPNGANIPVTETNKIRYIYLTANHRLNTQIDRQCKAFFRGLKDLIEPRWLKMFNQQELQILLGGAAVPIDIADLQANTTYSGYTSTDSTIRDFWSALQEMAEEERRKFIKFVTSCSRPPLLGFRELNPGFCIRSAGDDDERLPTSSTCVNLLKLPRYKSYNVLREKLLYAINAEAGFDLS